MCVGNEYSKSAELEKSLVPEYNKITGVDPATIKRDALAEITYQTGQFLFSFKHIYQHLKSWKYYRFV